MSERGGGLPKVETMALPHEKGVEVACNLLDAEMSSAAQVPPKLRVSNSFNIFECLRRVLFCSIRIYEKRTLKRL